LTSAAIEVVKRTHESNFVGVGENRYPSLQAAEAAALKPVVEALVAAIREGLASGALVVVDGKVVIAATEMAE
jgi:hypothetical protein